MTLRGWSGHEVSLSRCLAASVARCIASSHTATATVNVITTAAAPSSLAVIMHAVHRHVTASSDVMSSFHFTLCSLFLANR